MHKAESPEKDFFEEIPEVLDMSLMSTGTVSSIMSEAEGLWSHTDREMDRKIVAEITALHKRLNY